MVYDKTKFYPMNKNSQKHQQTKEAISKLKQAMVHPSVSALIYGYLKEKDINLLNMTVDEWKEIEKDLVEIILAEIYPGEEVPEDQLTFTSLAHSIAFMSNFIETLNRNLDKTVGGESTSEESSDGNITSDNQDEKQDDSDGPKFEL